MLTFDHLAISCDPLRPGVAHVEEALGVRLSPEGKHPHMGTHNRLLSLGGGEYLEVIAIDPDAPGPDQPRWFDLDRFDGPPRVTNWICRCDDLQAAMALAPDGIGKVWDLERAEFRWRMTIPEDGCLPFDGCFPALIEWQGAAHPAKRLPDAGVRLKEMVLYHPEADALRAALAPLISDDRIAVRQGDQPEIRALFSTRSDDVDLW
jgi:hypothetical protein